MNDLIPFAALSVLTASAVSVVRNRRAGVLDGIVTVVVAVVLLGDLPAPVEWLLVALALASMPVSILLVRRATTRAERAGDLEALERRSRLGFYLTGDPVWTAYSDLTAWRLKAQTDLAAARPYLERAARRRSPYQRYAQLGLVAVFGDGDVAELVQEHIREASPQARPLLLDLALTWLIHHGRTADALALLGTVHPDALRTPLHWRSVCDLASAIGDRDTVDDLLARHGPEASPAFAETARCIAERARGNVDAADRRLRAVDVPPGSLPEHYVALLLTHPTPVFDERHLDGAAGRGLQRYRELVGDR